MTIYDVIEAQRKALLDRDAAYLATVAGQWRGVESALNARALALATQVAALDASGTPVSLARLARLERYAALTKQAQSVIRSFAGDMAPGVAEQQQLAFDQGAIDAGEQLKSAGVSASFNRLSVGATNIIIGTAADGSPLRALLEAQWPSAVDAMTKSLIKGVALGINPRVIAREMSASSGAALSKMMTVARTEQLRAYREASRATYQQAGVKQYKRLAAKNARTCPTCLALDGKIYDVGEPMEIHPNDRCTSVPVVEGYKFPDRQTGAEWFAAQDESTQRDILGPGKLALYQEGVPLAAFVSRYNHPVWGPTVGGRSIADIKSNPRVVEAPTQSKKAYTPPDYAIQQTGKYTWRVGDHDVAITSAAKRSWDLQDVGTINGVPVRYSGNNFDKISKDQISEIFEKSILPAIAKIPRAHFDNLNALVITRWAESDGTLGSAGGSIDTKRGVFNINVSGAKGWGKDIAIAPPQAVIHEMGHVRSYALSDKNARKWLDAIGYSPDPRDVELWLSDYRMRGGTAIDESNPRILLHNPRPTASPVNGPTTYGRKNPAEAWAETYRLLHGATVGLDERDQVIYWQTRSFTNTDDKYPDDKARLLQVMSEILADEDNSNI